MAVSLSIGSNGYAAKDSGGAVNVYAYRADRIASINQELRVVADRSLVRMVLIVGPEFPSCLEQHLTPNIVVRLPLGRIGWRHKFVVWHSARLANVSNEPHAAAT